MGATLSRCTSDEPARGKDTAAARDTLPAAPDRLDVAPVTWDTAAGFFFAIAGETSTRARLVNTRYAESDQLDTLRLAGPAIDTLQLELFAGGDAVGQARVAAISDVAGAQCAAWPVVELAATTAGAPARDWRVAFPRGRVTVLPFDSLPQLSSADSSRLTVAIALAASRVADDTATAFRGRPYVVRQANRIGIADVVFVEVARTVQQEANPLQEQLVMVLERSDEARDPRDPYVTRFHRRAITLEEHVAAVELMAAFRVNRTGTLGLLVRRESEEGTTFVLLQPAGDGTWYERWRSPLATC